MMKLALGPIPYYWPRETVLAFHDAVARGPIDVVYLGEVTCLRRHELRVPDWIALARMLASAGKEVVLSTPALIESESDLKVMRKIVANGEYLVEANEMGAVRLARANGHFVAGASLNVYNPETLALLASLGARRWVAPPEISREAITLLHASRPAGVETEVLVWGRIPLAHSARCFTARHLNLQKDDCRFSCIDYPEGLGLATGDGERVFVLNGVQTLSAKSCNLVRELPAMSALGIDVARVSPNRHTTLEVATLVRAAIASPSDAAAAAHEIETLAGEGCDGFWHGERGMERSAAPERTS